LTLSETRSVVVALSQHLSQPAFDAAIRDKPHNSDEHIKRTTCRERPNEEIASRLKYSCKAIAILILRMTSLVTCPALVSFACSVSATRAATRAVNERDNFTG